jgi:hypothetical protein
LVSKLSLSVFIVRGSPFDDNVRQEIDILREQIKTKKDAGLLQEARELQNALREKVI